MAKLIIKPPDGDERIHELTDDVTSIGRASTNIIQLKDEKASREHCRIVREGDGYRLEDLGSRNGVTVNGLKVASQTLKVGDVVAVGDWRIIFDQEVSVGAEELFSTVGVEPLAEQAALSKTQPTSAAAGEKYVLVVTAGAEKGKQIDVGDHLSAVPGAAQAGKVTIGRHPSSTLQLSDEAASNHHAEIVKEAIGYVITDLGSTNGTFVNGEKTVKSPLAHGVEIRIGQTIMLFKDLNRQVDEDAVFGTVVLDTAQFEKELAQAEAGAGVAAIGRIAAILVLVGAVAGVAYAIYAGVRHFLVPSYGAPAGSLVTQNFSFDGDTGPTGAPKGWEWDTSRYLVWEVDNTADRFDDNPKKAALSLRRQPEANMAAYSECRYTDPLAVTGGTQLDVSAWVMTQNVAGAYGIAMHYYGPEGLEDADYVTFWGPKPGWSECKGRLTVPTWANQVRLSLYGLGNQGKIYYDYVSCKPAPEPAAEREVVVTASGIQALVTPAGVLFARLKGAMAVYRGEIVALTQERVRSLQAHGMPEKVLASGDGVTASGHFVEWATLNWVHYTVRTYPARHGVGVSIEVSADQEVALERLVYMLDIGGQQSQFGVDDPVVHGEGVEVEYASGKRLGEVREAVFQGVREDTLALFFPDKPLPLRITQKGRKFEVEILLSQKSLLGPQPAAATFELNINSTLEELKLSRLQQQLDAAWKDGTAARIRGTLDELAAGFGTRAEVANLLKARRAALAARHEAEKLRLERLVAALRQASAPEARVAARTALDEFLNAALAYWSGTPEAADYKQAQTEAQRIVDEWAAGEREQKAAELLDKVYKMLNAKMYPIALSLLNKLITEYQGTQAEAKASQSNLKSIIQQSLARLEQERAAVQRILDRIKNYELNQQYRQALQIIRTDPGYPLVQDNEDIKAKVKELEAKLAEAGGGE